jgi:hypothetical protein
MTCMIQMLTRLGVILLFTAFDLSTAQAQTSRPIITLHNANRLTQLSRLGHGSVGGAAWAPDGIGFYVAGSEGLWRYSPRDWDSPP